jgi:hypothetical protein
MQPFDALRSGTAARVTWKRPRTLTANTRSHSSSESVSRSFGFHDAVVPALLISASRRPNVCSTDFSIARTPGSSLTSQRSKSVFAPSVCASPAVSRAAASLEL